MFRNPISNILFPPQFIRLIIWGGESLQMLSLQLNFKYHEVLELSQHMVMVSCYHGGDTCPLDTWDQQSLHCTVWSRTLLCHSLWWTLGTCWRWSDDSQSQDTHYLTRWDEDDIIRVRCLTCDQGGNESDLTKVHVWWLPVKCEILQLNRSRSVCHTATWLVSLSNTGLWLVRSSNAWLWLVDTCFPHFQDSEDSCWCQAEDWWSHPPE